METTELPTATADSAFATAPEGTRILSVSEIVDRRTNRAGKAAKATPPPAPEPAPTVKPIDQLLAAVREVKPKEAVRPTKLPEAILRDVLTDEDKATLAGHFGRAMANYSPSADGTLNAPAVAS